MVIACLFWPVTRAAWLQSCCHSATWNLMGSTHFALAWAGMYRWAQVATTTIERKQLSTVKMVPNETYLSNMFVLSYFHILSFFNFYFRHLLTYLYQLSFVGHSQGGNLGHVGISSHAIRFGVTWTKWPMSSFPWKKWHDLFWGKRKILNSESYTWFCGPIFVCLYPCIGSHPPPLLLETWLCRSEVGPCLSSKATNGRWNWACCPMRQVHLTCFWWWLQFQIQYNHKTLIYSGCVRFF